MNLAYITTWDPLNIRAFSGTSYHLAQTLLAQGIALEYVGPLSQNHSWLVDSKSWWYRYILQKNHRKDREQAILKSYAEQITRKLAGRNFDLVLSLGTVPVAVFESERPIVNYMDTTFQGALDFNPGFTKLCDETIRRGHAVEKEVIQRCALSIYSSDWAARSAINYYQADPQRVKVVPYGANLESSRNLAEIKRLVGLRPKDRCRLLFVGVNWVRKGGPLALEVAQKLNQAGLETELFIVGCTPEAKESLPPYVKLMGFLDKGIPEQRHKLCELYAQAHFLIHPSLNENFGIVMCEANSFGVPCLARRIGGIPTVIREGLNGKTFDADAGSDEYCAYITNLFQNYAQYEQLTLTAFNEYETRLNWKTAGRTMKELLATLL